MSSFRQDADGPDGVWDRSLDLFIQGLIVFSLITFSIETLPDLSPPVQQFLAWAEFLSVVIFTIEYLIRVGLARRKLAFVFSIMGLIDLLAIAPYYVGLFWGSGPVDLRAVRAFRLFRLVRTFKLFRYSKAIRRYHRALMIAREEIVLFAGVALLLIYFSGVGIYYCENHAQPKAFASVFHGIWWALCTLTTVGYGDVYPVTVAGKMFTFLVLGIGLGFISVPAGLVASALSRARQMEVEESHQLERASEALHQLTDGA